ncbi:polysaccharide lyase family 8 super-sandwich domain-containing protein [Mucilaginibacter sp. AW1-3]
MKKVVFLLLLLPFISKTYSQSDLNQTRLKPIYDHCRELLLSDTPYATEQSYLLTDEVKYTTDGAGYFKLLTAEGNWKDIDYQSKQPAAWIPANHLYRVLLLARAYHKNHDAAYLEAIHCAAKFWIKNDIQCSNWWQNQINTPFTFSSLMIMMDKDANADELAYLNDVLVKRVPIKNATGQNLIWQLDNQARIALIHQDFEAFSTSMKSMQAVINVSIKEGIQPDYSFQQHGVMLQFGNYGLHFVNSLLFWMTITANTPLAFDRDKQQMLFDYCSNGLRWTVFKGGMDLTAIGRQFREDCDTKRGNCLFVDFNLLKSFDKNDPCKYVLDGMDSAPACNLTANKSFWRSAYMTTLTKDNSMMSVKMSGLLVKKLESINGDNLRGSFLNDGVTLIQRTGKEYHNIEPVWNWRMLPGVTSDTTINPEVKETWTTTNASGFVGQVSDGQAGISAMVYNRLGVKANKSYFFIDGMMVALGAGVTGNNPESLITTINQALSHGKKFYPGHDAVGGNWLNFDHIAYFFPDKGQTVKTDIRYVKGNWGDVDKGSGNVPVADSVMTVYIEQAKSDHYVYIVKPNITVNDTKKLAANIPVKVLANTPDLQAIAVNKHVLAVFYAPGAISIRGAQKLRASAPCIVIFKPNGTIWVTDPTQKLTELNLAVNEHLVKVKLPAGDMAGSSIKVDY